MDLWSAIFTVIRRWYVSLPILVISLVAMFAIGGGIQPDYEATASIVFNPPSRKVVSGQEQSFRNQYAEDTQTLAAAVYRQINSSDEQRRLEEDGFSPRYEVELDQFSAIMDITVTGTSPEQALDTANQLIREAERTATAIQRQGQPPEDELVNVDAVSLPVDAELVPGSKTRVMATILLLGLVGAASAAFIVESLVNRRRRGPTGPVPHLDPLYAAYAAGYPQLPPGAYAPPTAAYGPTGPLPGPFPGYAAVMPVPAAQPTPARAPAPNGAPAYAGANGYATAAGPVDQAHAPVAESPSHESSDELDSLLAEVDSEAGRAPRRPPEGQIINRGRSASRPEGSDAGRRPTQPFEGPSDEPDAPILVGAGEAEEAPAGSSTAWSEASPEPRVEVDAEDGDDVEPAAAEASDADDAPAASPDDAADDEVTEQADAPSAAEAADSVVEDTVPEAEVAGSAEAEVPEVETAAVEAVEPAEAPADPVDASSEPAAETQPEAGDTEPQAGDTESEDTEPTDTGSTDDGSTVDDEADFAVAHTPEPDATPASRPDQDAAETASPEATADDERDDSDPVDDRVEVGAAPAVMHRNELSERRREPAASGALKGRSSRGLGGDRGTARSGVGSGVGRNSPGSGGSGGSGRGTGGAGDRGGSVRNQGNSRSASRRNRRSLFASQGDAPVAETGDPAGGPGVPASGVPGSGVNAEAAATPDGD